MKRRAILGGVAGLLAVGGAAWKFGLFGRHYPPTPYDDLLGQIDDREPAIVFGGEARKTLPGPASIAAQLRRDGQSLSQRAQAEPADGKVAEIGGWIVPRSVALYAALAAQV
jgi:hypothetical protein